MLLAKSSVGCSDTVKCIIDKLKARPVIILIMKYSLQTPSQGWRKANTKLKANVTAYKLLFHLHGS